MNLGLQEALNAFLSTQNGSLLQPGEERFQDSCPVAVLADSSSGRLVARFRSDGFTYIQEFALLRSERTTRWIIPIGISKCTSRSLNIYAPYATRARVLKRLLMIVTWMGWMGWVRHKLVIASRQPLSLESFASEITGEPHPVFALSLGMPNRFRKLTIQVMSRDGEILGYVKLPMTHAATARVRHEAATLEYLSRFSELKSHIPRVLYAGDWGSGYILFQSAGPLRPAPTEFGPPHDEFLKKLRSTDGIEKPGEVQVEETGKRWQIAQQHLDPEWRDLGTAALMTASLELRRVNIRCGITHGDFAPWNTRISGSRLFIFDWESAERHSPHEWDIFHFHTQVSSLLNARKRRKIPLDRVSGERALYLLYLLDSVSHSLDETKQGNQIAVTFRRRLMMEELSE